MKLIPPSPAIQLGGNLIDPFCDNQRRSIDSLRQEVSEGPIEAARKQHTLTVLNDQCKRAVDS
jgi:hypothetical protein